jgi:uncharacterized DUF497 family protein
MEVKHHLNGTDFVWDDRKAASNPGKHDGVTFEHAATVFFDPLFRLVDAFIRIISTRKASNDERRDHEHL